MKYIDADKLIAEIENRLHCNGAFDEVGDSQWHYDQGVVDAYKHIKEFITSLQQEQPVEGLDLDFQAFAKEMDELWSLPSEETKNDEDDPLRWEYAIARHFYDIGCRRTAEKYDEIEYNRQRAEEAGITKGLEEEISRYLREECSSDDEPAVSEIARHFAEWGKNNLK